MLHAVEPPASSDTGAGAAGAGRLRRAPPLLPRQLDGPRPQTKPRL